MSESKDLLFQRMTTEKLKRVEKEISTLKKRERN